MTAAQDRAQIIAWGLVLMAVKATVKVPAKKDVMEVASLFVL